MRWPLVAAVLVVAAVITPGTAGLPRGVGSERELAAAEFGYPIPFVTADLRRLTPPSFPQSISWNPWEDPAEIHEGRLVASYAIMLAATALAAAGAVAAVRRVG